MLKFKEIGELSELLAATLAQLDRVARLYPYLEELDGINRTELSTLLELCDNCQHIDDLAGFIKYIQLPRTKGQIFLQDNGRYVMDTTGLELTCGRPVEVYAAAGEHPDQCQWQIGRVEHSFKHGGYYFYGQSGDQYPLQNGMLVAVRTSI